MWNIQICEMKCVTWGCILFGLGKAALEHRQLSRDPGDRGSQLSEHEEERAPQAEEAVGGRGGAGGGRGVREASSARLGTAL